LKGDPLAGKNAADAGTARAKPKTQHRMSKVAPQQTAHVDHEGHDDSAEVLMGTNPDRFFETIARRLWNEKEALMEMFGVYLKQDEASGDQIVRRLSGNEAADKFIAAVKPRLNAWFAKQKPPFSAEAYLQSVPRVVDLATVLMGQESRVQITRKDFGHIIAEAELRFHTRAPLAIEGDGAQTDSTDDPIAEAAAKKAFKRRKKMSLMRKAPESRLRSEMSDAWGDEGGAFGIYDPDEELPEGSSGMFG
jgi:hypothetical protein